MATTIRELLTKIGVEVDSGELDELDKKIGVFKKRMAGLAKFAGAVSAALTGTVVTSALAGNAAAKGADRTGLLVERYQELKFAAGQADVATEQLEAALRFANVQLGEAERGSEGAAQRFDDLGISTRGANGELKTADRLLLDVARALEGETDAALLGAKAARIFGEEAGPRLVPLLKQGEAGVLALMRRAHELGGVIGEDAARQSERFFDRLDDLKTIALGLRNVFAARLLPPINDFLDTLIRLQLESRELVAAKLDRWAARLGRALEVLRRIAINVNRAISAFGASATWVDLLANSVIALGAALTAATLVAGVAALRQLFAIIQGIGVRAILSWAAANALLLGQIALAVAAFLAIGLAVDDFLTFLRGGDSVIGRFFERFGVADELRETLVAFGREAKRAIDPLLDVMRDLFAGVDVQGFVDDWITGLGELQPFIESTVSGLVELLRLYQEWQERIDLGGVTEAERDARNAAADDEAIRAALARRAAREGTTVEALALQRIAEGTATDVERAIAGSVADRQAPASSSVDRSRRVSTGDTTINFAGVPGPDQEAVARRVLAEQTRQVRSNLVEGGAL